MQRTEGPLGNRNRLKLATFASNCEGIIATPKLSWPETTWAAQFADRVGFEAIVPLSRWRGEPGQRAYDTMTWAAGVAAITRHAAIFSTIDMGIVHPVMAAKQMATLDHISGGRAAANVVAGWYEAEALMFGRDLAEHDTRYDRADEWTQIVLDLWTAEEFEERSFEGAHYTMKNGFLSPQPLQKPHPPLMNAGSSARSQEYIARYADIAFAPGVQLVDAEAGAPRIAELKAKATALGRSLQVFTFIALFIADTEEEAEAALERYREEHYTGEERERYYQRVQQQTHILNDGHRASLDRSLGLALAVCGTPETVAEQFAALSAIGVDGLLLTWPDWRDGLPRFERDILPRLERAGLREPFARAAEEEEEEEEEATTAG